MVLQTCPTHLPSLASHSQVTQPTLASPSPPSTHTGKKHSARAKACVPNSPIFPSQQSLLLNILPRRIANRLKSGEHPIADGHEAVTVVFIDMVGFTNLSSGLSPADLVRFLNEFFSLFDELAAFHRIEKIKTIGPCSSRSLPLSFLLILLLCIVACKLCGRGFFVSSSPWHFVSDGA